MNTSYRTSFCVMGIRQIAFIFNSSMAFVILVCIYYTTSVRDGDVVNEMPKRQQINDVIKSVHKTRRPKRKSRILQTTCDKSVRKSRLPNLILIGERKTGTGVLLKDLTLLHPYIRRTYQDEVHYFDYQYENGLQWYQNQMKPSCPGDVTMEKSPSYFRTKGVAKRIFDFNTDIKLLLSLRDPVSRAVSDFSYEKRRMQRRGRYESIHYFNHTFDELAISNTTGKVNTSFAVLERSLYDVHIEQWLELFPLNQIHVIDADNLSKNNPTIELQKIEKFLGLPNFIQEEAFYYDEEKHFFCLTNYGCAIDEKGHITQKPNAVAQRKLMNYFRPHMQKLYKKTQWNMTWMEKYLD